MMFFHVREKSIAKQVTIITIIMGSPMNSEVLDVHSVRPGLCPGDDSDLFGNALFAHVKEHLCKDSKEVYECPEACREILY